MKQVLAIKYRIFVQEGNVMTKQIQEACIVVATRTPVGNAPRGMFSNTRSDDLARLGISWNGGKVVGFCMEI